jgi:hypothetical protein
MTAALLALLLLSYASVQSTVMQVAMAAPAGLMPMCSEAMAGMGPMAGMAMTPKAETASGPAANAAASKSGHRHQGQPACPYCAAAAHLPVLTGGVPLRTPVAFVFAAYRVQVAHGPRGPPSIQPRARGPPADLQLI